MRKNEVKFIDFQKEYRSIKGKVDGAIRRVLRSGWYILGKEVESFEAELSSFIGTKYAVGVSSGTDALTLAIKSLGLGRGDGVVVPTNSYPTAFGVALSGVNIQLADVDPKTLNISLDTVKRVVTKSTKAIVIVHLYGNPADLAPIKEFIKEKELYLIEDCAQAFGAKYKSRKVGTFGDVACFSFYPTKNLGAYGDAGAILTNNKRIFENARLLRMYGEKARYESILLGHNSRLDEIQAAILRTKLKYVNRWNRQRRSLAKIYRKGLARLPVEIVQTIKTAESVYHLLVVQTTQRSSLVQHLKLRGISTGIHFPVPIHLTRTFSYLGHKKGDFPVSETGCDSVLSLPLYPQMTEGEVNYVISCVREFFDKNK